MSQNMLEQIRNFLNSEGVTFREVEHEPTRTSEESAAARGEDLSIGAKALLLKTDDSLRLFVLPANRKLDSGAIRRPSMNYTGWWDWCRVPFRHLASRSCHSNSLRMNPWGQIPTG